MSAAEAASILGDVRTARDSVNNRAAAISWMMWALVITSLAGSLGALNYLTLRELTNVQWGLFLLANVLVIATWAGIGAAFQNAVWHAFSLSRPPGQSNWKGPVAAFGVAFLLVIANLLLQGLTRAIQGADDSWTNADYEHNLGLAMTLGVGGAVLVAVSILMGSRGYAIRPGILVGIGAILVGHLTTFLWVPEFGPTGPALAFLAIPVSFVATGYIYWRKG